MNPGARVPGIGLGLTCAHGSVEPSEDGKCVCVCEFQNRTSVQQRRSSKRVSGGRAYMYMTSGVCHDEERRAFERLGKNEGCPGSQVAKNGAGSSRSLSFQGKVGNAA